MSLILNIETATTVCSVALFEKERLLCLKELNEGYTHAENLHIFIAEALKEAGLKAGQLDAVAVSKGPGSYTGLRIGVSTAKGLAYALNIPLIGVDTLEVMASAARTATREDVLFCPMIDARRMEVYTALYDAGLRQKHPVEALIVNEQSLSRFRQGGRICFFGDGMPKCKSLLSQIEEASFLEGIFPSAVHMIRPALRRFQSKTFEALAYFEPFYLKDFLILKKNPEK